MIELTRYTIKPGKTQQVDQWIKLIRENSQTEKDEQVREGEKMLVETIFRQKEGDKEYLYWFHIQ